ncbi:MAG: hypothetical protein ACXAE3_08395 [Candidatus Kariarchaeaceae archaeon]|jgi:hypothetical protein
MKRWVSFLLYLWDALVALIFLDAIIFILTPVNYFGEFLGKRFDTIMYEKSSLFFEVRNGANFSLRFTFLAFLIWYSFAFILTFLADRDNSLKETKLYRRSRLWGLLLPTLTWFVVLTLEMYPNNSILQLIWLLILTFAVYSLPQFFVHLTIEVEFSDFIPAADTPLLKLIILYSSLAVLVIANLFSAMIALSMGWDG